ncbi:hypothetical protein [Nocardiopsis sp. Huas11]|uniref:hypothetical protein n=1 Tax=Nocardiopsis sp. Huas11 TaxID=2183912 RepID=UPI001F3DEA06|nr:hypothetical protein [Nocardiopsis sp. Huas11]
MALGKPELEKHVLGNVFFDTCVYHQPGIDLLLDVVPHENILFASEMIGAVRDIDRARATTSTTRVATSNARTCPTPSARPSRRATPAGSTRGSTPC